MKALTTSAVSRADLVGTTDLSAGQSIAGQIAFERGADDEWGWKVSEVRAVSADEAVAIELGGLCESLQSAASRRDEARSLSDLVSDDDVVEAQESWVRANDNLKSRVPELGRDLHARGGEDTMRAVLDLVDPKYREQIAAEWRGIGAWTG